MNKEFQDILVGIKRTFSLLSQKEKQSLFIATCIMVITGALTNIPALVLGKLVDSLTSRQTIQFSLIIPFIATIIVIILIRESLTVIRKYLVENIATQTDKEQTVRTIERLLKTDIQTFLHAQQIGSLHGKLFRSMQGLIKLLKLLFLDFAPIFFTAFAAILIALFEKPLLATVMILVIPTGLYLIVKQVSSQKGIRIALLRGKEKIDGKVVEMLGGIETIRVLHTESFEVNKIEEIAESLRKIEIRHHIFMAFFDAAKYLNEGFFYILVILLAIFLASIGTISKGDILVYSILFTSITSPLREIHRILDEAHESSIRVNDLYTLLHEPLDESFKETASENINHNNKIIIKTNNLSFSYGEQSILQNMNITIQNGESIGIAGASGCGKSTLIQLLLKLTHGYTGDIELFGENISKVSRIDIAKKIAYIPQRPFIFSGTIKENIMYGINRPVTMEELVTAAKRAQVYQEIEEDLGGFNGKITENGNNISGGQRQRLAITRVMLSSPEVLIFDEATSALDNTNEANVQKNIEEHFNGSTIIMIAHRLTTLKNCDRILVFDKGEIVQTGTFTVLSKKDGLFQDFLKQRIKK